MAAADRRLSVAAIGYRSDDYASLRLLVGALELAQQFVTTLNRVIQSLRGGFAAIPDGFHFFVDDVANLHEITETNAT